jgi:hypothetical protein
MGSAIIGDDAPGNQTVPEGTSRAARALPQRGPVKRPSGGRMRRSAILTRDGEQVLVWLR